MRTIQFILDELIENQSKKLYECAQQIIPNITKDDMLQPNDFPKLENHPYFRYEEGVFEGLMTVKMALMAEEKEHQTSSF